MGSVGDRGEAFSFPCNPALSSCPSSRASLVRLKGALSVAEESGRWVSAAEMSGWLSTAFLDRLDTADWLVPLSRDGWLAVIHKHPHGQYGW